MRNHPSIFGLFVLVGLLVPTQSRADHFTIDLQVKSPKEAKTAHAESAPPAAKAKARMIVVAETGKPIRALWTVSSAAKDDEMKDVLIHFFVVRVAEVGQKTVPKLDKDVAAETALTMDFQPTDKASGQLEFQIDKPGAYLVRLETLGSANDPSHEQFAALDLVVK
jgi:hypothetical protein